MTLCKLTCRITSPGKFIFTVHLPNLIQIDFASVELLAAYVAQHNLTTKL